MQVKVTLFQLLECLVSIVFCAWLYDRMFGEDFRSQLNQQSIQLAILVVTCWLAMGIFGKGERNLRTWFDRFFTAVGFMLLVQYGLTYLFHIDLLPWVVLVSGSGLAVTLTTLLTDPEEQSDSHGILMLGFGSTSQRLSPALGGRIVGVLDDQPGRVGADLPLLGGTDRLAEAVAQKRPGCIIVGDDDRLLRVDRRQLLRLRYAGIAVEPASAFYESIFARVNSDALDPFQLIFSSAFMASRAAMAVQAVYTNVIALSLLILLSPLLLLIAAAIAITSGGPVLERIGCPGFQQIPFKLLRFRTTGPLGEKSRIGDWITRLGIVSLPGLINVARGEMTLVGPPPVRAEFARCLASLIPVYGHRFTVRPGMLGWSQINLRGVPVPDERLRLEYDLFYVKQGSPSMDLDIFFRTLFRMSAAPELTRTPEAS